MLVLCSQCVLSWRLALEIQKLLRQCFRGLSRLCADAGTGPKAAVNVVRNVLIPRRISTYLFFTALARSVNISTSIFGGVRAIRVFEAWKSAIRHRYIRSQPRVLVKVDLHVIVCKRYRTFLKQIIYLWNRKTLIVDLKVCRTSSSSREKLTP